MRLTTFATAVFFGENSEFFVFFCKYNADMEDIKVYESWSIIPKAFQERWRGKRVAASNRPGRETCRQVTPNTAFRKSSFCFFSTLYLWIVVGFESCSAPQQTQHSKSRSGSQPRWSFFVLPKHILAPKRQAQTLEISLVTTLVDHPHLELMIILETGDRWWAQGSSLGLTSKDPFCDTSSTKNQIQTSMFGQKNQWVQNPSPAFIQVDRWSIWSHCHWHWPEKGNQWLGLSAGQCTLLRVKDDVSASLWRLFSKSKPQEAKLAAMASPYRRIKLHVGKRSPRVWQVFLDSRQKDAETSSFRHRSVDRLVLLDHFTFKSAVSGTYLQCDIFRESKLLSTGAGLYLWTTPVENVASEKGRKKTRSAWNLSCFTYFWIWAKRVYCICLNTYSFL